MKHLWKLIALLFTLNSPSVATFSQTSDPDTINDRVLHLLSRKFELKGEALLEEVLILDQKYQLSEEDIRTFLSQVPVEKVNGGSNVTLWIPKDQSNLKKALISSALFPLDYDSQQPYDCTWSGKDHNIKQLAYAACFDNPEAISLLEASASITMIKDENRFFNIFKKIPTSNDAMEYSSDIYIKYFYKTYIINCAKFIDIDKAIKTHNDYIKWSSLYPKLIDNEDSETYYKEISFLMEKVLEISMQETFNRKRQED